MIAILSLATLYITSSRVLRPHRMSGGNFILVLRDYCYFRIEYVLQTIVSLGTL